MTGRSGCFLVSAFGIATLLMPATAFSQDLDVPYVATPHVLVEQMMDLANVGPGDHVIDLGSGDGRIVIAAARRGAVGLGVDLDPELVEESERNARRAGVSDRTVFLEQDLFDTDLSRATVVTLFLLDEVNLRLRPVLLEELRPGTRVVSHAFGMGAWEPDGFVDAPQGQLYFWVIPARIEGEWEWSVDGERFTIAVRQRYQELRVEPRSGGGSTVVEHAELRGDRLTLIVRDPDGDRVYNGRVEGERVIGTVQVRSGSDRTVERWLAVRTR